MYTIAEKKKLMETLKGEVISLTQSPLFEERIKNKVEPVLGEGSLTASIMFIGEAPGKKEAQTGKPFCGASGRVLDELLAHLKLPREKVYITNIVKDRPRDNRDPTPEEIACYGPFLNREIEIIKPKVVATLGRYSMIYLMEKFGLGHKLLPIGKMHGKVFKAITSFGEIKIVPLYHPAVAVYNSHTKDALKKDFEALNSFL